jgi:hypothetical protein
MFDTSLLRPSLHCNTSLPFTQLHFTTLRYTSPNYTSPHFTQLHFTTLHPTSLHFTTLHPTTLHYTSLHFTQLHFTTLIDTSLPLIYVSLPSHLALHIYIFYRSISPHITTLDMFASNDTLTFNVCTSFAKSAVLFGTSNYKSVVDICTRDNQFAVDIFLSKH